MLRNIEVVTPCASNQAEELRDLDIPLPRSPIIKQATVVRHLEAGDVLAKAQNRAQEYIARAEKDAEQAKALGFRRGLQQGIVAALSPISAMISQWEQVRATLRKDAENALRAGLHDLAKREPMLNTLIDMTLQAHIARPPTSVTIHVPPGADLHALQDQCVALGLTAKIEFGDRQDLFSIGWDGHVWTAHLGELADLAVAGHTQTCDDIALSSSEASELCRNALVDVMKGWPSNTEDKQEPG